MRTSGIRHGDCDYDFAFARRIMNTHFHAVKVTADVSSVLVAERNVERGAGPGAFLRGRTERSSFSKRLAHRRAELRVQNGSGVLEFPLRPDSGGLAETFDPRSGN